MVTYRVPTRLRGAVIAVVALSALISGNAQAAEYRASDVQAAIAALSGTFSERAGSLERLSEMGAEAKDAVPELMGVLETDQSPVIRGKAAQALGNIGPASVAAIPALIDFVKDPNGGYDRAYVPTALGDIGQKPETVVPLLTDLLQHDEEPVVRQLSARALGDFGEKANEAVPALIQAIRQGDKNLREAAAYGLTKIPARPADIPALTEMLTDPIDTARVSAARSLGGAGTEAAAAVPSLIGLLTDKNTAVRSAAAAALGAIGPDAKAAIPALKLALKDAEISSEANSALEHIRVKR